MDTSSRNPPDDFESGSSPAIAEFDVVRLTRSVDAEGYRIPKHASGTVVAVYDRGSAYAVEIAGLPGGPAVVTLRAGQIERIH
jgi:hypothetical protein